MGATSTKGTTGKNQSIPTANVPVVHQTLTSTRRASLHSNSGERRSSVTSEGKERRPSLTREQLDLTRSTATSNSKIGDSSTRPRRASIQPRTSTVMEEAPAVQTSTKTESSAGGSSIFNKCCGTSDTA